MAGVLPESVKLCQGGMKHLQLSIIFATQHPPNIKM